jgi:hypothetical protein
MKQTAVDWFYEEIWKQFGFSCSSNILEKAKEMEKQQIINAWIVADNELQRTEAEKYYNLSYKKD